MKPHTVARFEITVFNLRDHLSFASPETVDLPEAVRLLGRKVDELVFERHD
jgi:hypothetical protein